MTSISQQELNEINRDFEPTDNGELSVMNDPDRKKVELKDDVITNDEVKTVLNIKSTDNERDTVSEDSIIAGEPNEPQKYPESEAKLERKNTAD